MWDVKEDLDRDGKDVPCNTHIYFKVRDKKLNMTVCNRSNDGTGSVRCQRSTYCQCYKNTFALRLEIAVGEYTQISDSFHVYQNDVWERCKELGVIDIYSWRSTKNDYEYIKQKDLVPLITNSRTFQWELDLFFAAFDDVITTGELFSTKDYIRTNKNFQNPSIRDIAIPMVNAYMFHKHRQYEDFMLWTNKIKAYDWMKACFEWVRKRDTTFTLKIADN